MRTVLRRFLILTMLGALTAALAAGAAMAKQGDPPGHGATPGNTGAGQANGYAFGAAASHGSSTSTTQDSSATTGSSVTSSSPATVPSAPAGPSRSHGSTPAAAAASDSPPSSHGSDSPPSSHGFTQPRDGAGPAAAPGRSGSNEGRGPGSGAFDLSHVVSSFQKRIERLAMQGRTATSGSLTQVADCGYGPNTQEFLPWGDSATYNLAPQGDLASTSGWSLTSASVSTEHDPYSNAVASVSLTSDNSKAVTPVMCVNLQNPTMRFFLSHSGPQSNSAVDVYVIYEGLDGHSHTLTLASVQAGSSWQPSPIIPIAVNLLSTASVSGWTPVAFGFTVHGLQPGESYSLDGVYVDPCWSR